MTKATQPAKRPPPRIVVPNDKYPLWECDPSKRSRTPPCTISTERVSSAPIANHHAKDLTSIHTASHLEASDPLLKATLAEGCRAVKQMACSFVYQSACAFRVPLIGPQRLTHARISSLDGGISRRNRFHYRLSRGPALRLPLSSPDRQTPQRGRVLFDSFSGDTQMCRPLGQTGSTNRSTAG
jgi:hypothetical protein